MIKKSHPKVQVLLGGHSLGGGTALRFASGKYAGLVEGYLLLAPYIHPLASTSRKDLPRKMVRLYWGRILLLNILRSLGIRRFEHWRVFSGYRQPELCHGSETLHLSYRLAVSRLPGLKFASDVKKIRKPTFVLVGGDDELFYSKLYENLFAGNKHIQTRILSGHNHDGILFSRQAYCEIEHWLNSPD
jgi:pimeloyl-ACP methyl ester carboxylesterase